LDIGAETPDEIAVSIIAEIHSKFTCRSGGFLKYRQGPIHKRGPGSDQVFKEGHLNPVLRKTSEKSQRIISNPLIGPGARQSPRVADNKQTQTLSAPMNTPPADIITSIVLAAGASSRLGQSKQLLLVEGEPLLRRIARTSCESNADRT